MRGSLDCNIGYKLHYIVSQFVVKWCAKTSLRRKNGVEQPSFLLMKHNVSEINDRWLKDIKMTTAVITSGLPLNYALPA